MWTSRRRGGRQQLVEQGVAGLHAARRRRLEHRVAHGLRCVAQRGDERRAALRLAELDRADRLAFVPLLVVAFGAHEPLAGYDLAVHAAEPELGAIGATPHPAILPAF